VSTYIHNTSHSIYACKHSLQVQIFSPVSFCTLFWGYPTIVGPECVHNKVCSIQSIHEAPVQYFFHLSRLLFLGCNHRPHVQASRTGLTYWPHVLALWTGLMDWPYGLALRTGLTDWPYGLALLNVHLHPVKDTSRPLTVTRN
jgi:hypothetical protein